MKVYLCIYLRFDKMIFIIKPAELTVYHGSGNKSSVFTDENKFVFITTAAYFIQKLVNLTRNLYSSHSGVGFCLVIDERRAFVVGCHCAVNIDIYCSYLYDTDDPEIRKILRDNGAFRSIDDFEGCRFAMETMNGEIIAFDSEFQWEVFQAYLKEYGLTEEKVIEMLSEGYDVDEDEDLPEDFDYFYEEEFSALGITLKDGKIVLEDMWGNSGCGTRELLEQLGWDCDFEGDSWKLETIGVYYID